MTSLLRIRPARSARVEPFAQAIDRRLHIARGQVLGVHRALFLVQRTFATFPLLSA